MHRLLRPAGSSSIHGVILGHTLARIERGMQWAIGDWFNAVKGDKWLACDWAGLNFHTARNCGWVAERFPLSGRQQDVSFDHHQKLASQELTEEQRYDLLKKASKNCWTRATLSRERDRLLGKPERVPVEDYDARMQRVISQLPTSASKKVQREVKSVLERLKHDFQDAVEREVQKRLEPERKRLLALEQEARAADDVANKRLAGITALMTEEEYNLIRGLLHPDRHPSEEHGRYTRAFEVFKRLKETIDPLTPTSVLRARGWAD